jgi:hypothetical protein
MIAAIARLTALANDDKNNTPLLPQRRVKMGAKPIAPIEFLFAGYMCFRFPGANNEQLSRLIDGMMKRARSEHSDLMINTTVERTIRGYIREVEILHPFAMSAVGLNTLVTQGSRKRIREQQQDDEEWLPSQDQISNLRSREDYLD